MERKRKISHIMEMQIFYLDLTFETEVFANDWDKYILLNALAAVKAIYSAEIYAFCVLDDSLKILSGGSSIKKQTLRRLIVSLMERYRNGVEKIGEEDESLDQGELRAKIVHLRKEDFTDVFRYIHLVPVSERYVMYCSDYWWTSYGTYRAHYIWKFVDTEKAMRALEQYDRQLVHSLSEFHRSGEKKGNIVPLSIKDNNYECLSRTCVWEGDNEDVWDATGTEDG